MSICVRVSYAAPPGLLIYAFSTAREILISVDGETFNGTGLIYNYNSLLGSFGPNKLATWNAASYDNYVTFTTDGWKTQQTTRVIAEGGMGGKMITSTDGSLIAIYGYSRPTFYFNRELTTYVRSAQDFSAAVSNPNNSSSILWWQNETGVAEQHSSDRYDWTLYTYMGEIRPSTGSASHNGVTYVYFGGNASAYNKPAFNRIALDKSYDYVVIEDAPIGSAVNAIIEISQTQVLIGITESNNLYLWEKIGDEPATITPILVGGGGCNGFAFNGKYYNALLQNGAVIRSLDLFTWEPAGFSANYTIVTT